MSRPRVFFLTYYPPTPTMGGAMAFYRHFIERQDFDLFVATTDRRVLEYKPPYQLLLFEQPAWLERLCRTRLDRWAHSYRHLVAGNFIPDNVLHAAQQFQPDFIFTIAGSWDWTTLMSGRLARKLRIPLVGSFNDWFDFGVIVHPWLRTTLEKRFRAFYRECDLAWCTCDGMREELGSHPNAQVLYPVGARPQSVESMQVDRPNDTSRFVVAFAGNLSNWYGHMFERLIKTAITSRAMIEFRIYGGNQSWSSEFDRMVRERNIFRGHLPFERLRHEMAEADALILLMGFETDCAQVERTSFKTKFLDYLACQKPILVWGPEYCSAVRVAREFDSAEVCTQPAAAAFLEKILALQKSPERQASLLHNARRMYEDRFHPDKIHQTFVTSFQKLIADRRN
jgi:glycosyltransferase involved in cell wall biosynthesis